MVNFDQVFFAKEGEKGLNETSATKLVAIASNLKTDAEASLEDISFLNVSMDIVGGTGNKLESEFGMKPETLETIITAVHRCGQLNGFISWLREAQKAIENERRNVLNLTIQDWADATNISLPIAPEPYNSKCKVYEFDDVLAMMNVKDRAEYLSIEAKAAEIGQLIHPNGSYDNARNELHRRIHKPTKCEGHGRETIVSYYAPSVDVKTVDKIYEQLQKQYQNYESSLNHMKSDLRKKLDALNQEETNKQRIELAEYKKNMEAYSQAYRDATLAFNQWQTDLLARVNKIKIAIPAQYEDLLQELYNVGK